MSINWSISFFWMMSGGESAMMSPVARTSSPRSKASTKRVCARLHRLAGNGIQLDGADQSDIADVDDVGQAFERVHRLFPIGREFGRAGEHPSSL